MAGWQEAMQPAKGLQQAVTVPRASGPSRSFTAGAQGEGSSLLPASTEGGNPSH